VGAPKSPYRNYKGGHPCPRKLCAFLGHGNVTGKTKTASDILRLVCYENNKVAKTLIVAPVVVLENWKRELELHTNIPVTTIQLVDGVTKINGKVLKNPQKKLKYEQVNQEKQIFIVNPELISETKSRSRVARIGPDWTVWENLTALHDFEMLIVDEAHLFKNYKAKRTKAIHKFTKQSTLKYRYILTGSPVLQDALDLWSQFYILDPSILGDNFFSFRDRFFYDKNVGMPSHLHFPEYVPKDEAYFKRFGYSEGEDLKTLSKIIFQHASRVMKYDVLDLPTLHFEKELVQMDEEQARVYKEFRDDLVAFLNGESDNLEESLELEEFELPEMMKADTAIVKTIRLQQIICGIFTNTKGEVSIISNERLLKLKQVLEERATRDAASKFIIWTVFKPTYELINAVCGELGLKAVFLNGTQSKDEKQAAVDAFNNDEEIRVIIANQGAGGTGVNLTRATHAIYYSRSFNLAHDLQSEARHHRGGQTRETYRIDLVTPDTIDEHVLEVLKRKKTHAEDILQPREFKAKEILGLI
jgi:SNF2 family DNA or RNA helicase